MKRIYNKSFQSNYFEREMKIFQFPYFERKPKYVLGKIKYARFLKVD